MFVVSMACEFFTHANDLSLKIEQNTSKKNSKQRIQVTKSTGKKKVQVEKEKSKEKNGNKKYR